jgi:hypothetical protein
LDDLIVGAYQADPSSKSNAGKSYVVFGKQDTNAIELSAIAAGTGGFVISGESEGDWSGYSVSSAGDVNGEPPSTRARLPAPVCFSAVILLALMMIVSLPKPALKTSMPPLPVRVSLPAPATKISSLLVAVLVRVLASY